MARMFDMVDTWNNITKVFNAIRMNVDDQNSSEQSNLINLQINNDTKFKVNKGGEVEAKGYINLPATIIISGTPDNVNLGTGTNIFRFQMPYGMLIEQIRLFINIPPSGANIEGTLKLGSLNQNIIINDGTDSLILDNLNFVINDQDIVSLDISQVGSLSNGAGLKITLLGKRR